jgi:predicted nucleotidyltransferase
VYNITLIEELTGGIMISLKSEAAKKLLNYFFLNPEENLYVNEMSRNLGVDKRNLVKKVKELESEGIIRCQKRGNLKLYSINKDYPLYQEYKKIIMKTTGLEEQLRQILKGVDGVREAYIFGSYARNAMEPHSDIDLLVVGSHRIMALQKMVYKLQKESGREINTVNLGEKEFKKKIKDNDQFISGILKQKHIRII